MDTIHIAAPSPIYTELLTADTVCTRRYPSSNSLGVAKSDCHTCRRAHEACDRQRPHCGTCIRSSRTCGGYVLDIVWKATAKPQRPGGTTAAKDVVSSRRPSSKHPCPLDNQYRFARTKSKRRRTKRSPDMIALMSVIGKPTDSEAADDLHLHKEVLPSKACPEPQIQSNLEEGSAVMLMEDDDNGDAFGPDRASLPDKNDLPDITATKFSFAKDASICSSWSPSNSEVEAIFNSDTGVEVCAPSLSVPWPSSDLSHGAHWFPLSHGVMYCSVVQKAGPIFDMCEWLNTRRYIWLTGLR
jgi:hypothetical protein